MLLTPLQELNAIYLGRFIALAEISPFEDTRATVVQLVHLVREYQQEDKRLLKQLRTVPGPSGTFDIDGEKVPFRSEIKKND